MPLEIWLVIGIALFIAIFEPTTSSKEKEDNDH
jgi:hypothetical protein